MLLLSVENFKMIIGIVGSYIVNCNHRTQISCKVFYFVISYNVDISGDFNAALSVQPLLIKSTTKAINYLLVCCFIVSNIFFSK